MSSLDDGGFLGERMRGLRKRRRMTMAELANAANLSTGYISQLERNLASPSIAALVAIARALQVTVQWFFAGDAAVPEDEKGYVIRRENRLSLHYEGGIVDELLTPKFSMQVEMIHTRMPAGSESAQSYSHAGEEVGYVLEGRVEFWVGDRHFLLGPGDSCTYSSHEPHRYRNPGPDPAIIIWAISPPGF